ncbi:MAG: enolase [Chlamydiae bacterium SM23_39]|nr:MAG: enolase [Chlamydiae bacterium SM23_39]
MKILNIHAIEILDSRGVPTLEVILETEGKNIQRAKVPSGASTGEHEALELRDNDEKRYFKKGVLKAVANVNGPINNLLKGKNIFDQYLLDKMMIDLDGTENKKNLGANAIIGTSMAIVKAAANAKKIPLYRYIQEQFFEEEKKFIFPCPMMNIINGGVHADTPLDIQEFIIRPIAAPSFKEAIRWGSEVFHSLKMLLKENNLSISVGDEGGFAPNIDSDEKALDFILKAIEKAGYKPKKEISIALDAAASSFYDKTKKKYFELKKKISKKPYKEKTSEEQLKYLEKLISNYPIDSIEDGLDENDWEGWIEMTKRLKDKIQIVGDDIFVTNKKFINKGIKNNVANAIIIKLNQIGTFSETIEVIKIAKKNNYNAIISHRSAETEDTFIADLSVGCSSRQIKTGSLSRSDRTSKYNRLLEIEDELKEKIYFKE